MSKILAIVVIVVLCEVSFPGQMPTPVSGTVVFTHVTVIDVTRGRLRPNITVVVNGNRIGAVSKATRVPRNAKVIDAAKKRILAQSKRAKWRTSYCSKRTHW